MAEKKQTTKKAAPAKTTAAKTEAVVKEAASEIKKEVKVMTQEALGMIETRGLTASIEAADAGIKHIHARHNAMIKEINFFIFSLSS